MSYLKDELSGFVPAEQAQEILTGVVRGSSVLRLSKVEPMVSDKKKFNVLVDGPGAYWIGEGKRIKTSGASWIHPEVTAKKLAVIIPVTKEKLNDTTISVFDELKTQITEVFYKAIDQAFLFGINSPYQVGNSLMDAIDKTGFMVIEETNMNLAVSDAMALVEGEGYEVTGFAGHIGLKNALRKLRDNNDAPIYLEGTGTKELYSQPIEFVRNGSWDRSRADLIAGDWKYSIIGMRSGIEFEVLTEATLQGTLDEDNKPLSLAEQDMIAIKATMRLGHLVIKDNAFAAYKIGTPLLGKLTVSAKEGTAAGRQLIHVSPECLLGNTLVYKTGDSAAAVTYEQDLSTGWTAFSNDSEIEIAAGKAITVAEVTEAGLAKKAGSCTISA